MKYFAFQYFFKTQQRSLQRTCPTLHWLCTLCAYCSPTRWRRAKITDASFQSMNQSRQVLLFIDKIDLKLCTKNIRTQTYPLSKMAERCQKIKEETLFFLQGVKDCKRITFLKWNEWSFGLDLNSLHHAVDILRSRTERRLPSKRSHDVINHPTRFCFCFLKLRFQFHVTF